MDLSFSEFYKKFRKTLLLTCFLFASALYINTLGHDFVLDDGIFFHDNSQVNEGSFKDIFTKSSLSGYNVADKNSYRPFTIAIFALEKSFFDQNPLGYHATNVISYALFCCLILYFLFLLIPKENFALPLSITLLYIAHPIHTEVVANIKSIDEIYAGLFGITSLILFLRNYETPKISLLFLTCLTYLLALLSKENAITFIVLFPMALIYSKNNTLVESAKSTLPLLTSLVIYFVLRWNALGSIFPDQDISSHQIINNSLFAANDKFEMIGTNFSIFLKYLQLSILPTSLAFDYSLGTFETIKLTSLKSLFGVIILMTMIAAIIKSWKSKSLIGFGLLFFLITFSITSNFFVKIASTLGERFLFTPSLGINITLIAVISYILSKWVPRYESKPQIILWILAPLLVFYSYKTINRNNDWKVNLSLFNSGIEVNPNAYRINLNLGNYYNKKVITTEHDSLKQQYLQASNQYLNIADSIVSPYMENSDSIIAEATNPNDLIFNRAFNLQLEGKHADAILLYKEIETSFANKSILYENIGLCYNSLLDCDNAITYFKLALESDPNLLRSYRLLGECLFEKNNIAEAIKAFTTLFYLSKEKDEKAAINIAVGHHILKNTEEAIKYYKIVLGINPDNQKAKQNLNALQ